MSIPSVLEMSGWWPGPSWWLGSRSSGSWWCASSLSVKFLYCMHLVSSISLAKVVMDGWPSWLKDLFRNVDASSVTETFSHTQSIMCIYWRSWWVSSYVESAVFKPLTFVTDRSWHIHSYPYLLSDTKNSWQQNPIRQSTVRNLSIQETKP